MAGAQRVDRVAVVTNDDEVAGLVAQLGHEVMRDAFDADLSAALQGASAELARRGADTVIILPGDLPTLRAADLDALLERHLERDADGISLCPAIRDGGTNALVCTPPDAIALQFGKDSAARHLDAAAERGVPAQRLCMQAFFRDIDVADDLLWLSARDDDSHTCRFLRQSGIFARLTLGPTGTTA